MRKNFGFTLIELLVVIGILSILAVALLIAINPAEAQRKARDTQRLKDLSNLQAALEGWINDNPGITLSLTASSGGTGSVIRDCGTAGWLGGGGTVVSVCNYLNRLPVDPRNTLTQITNSAGVESTGVANYYVRGSGGVYNICAYLESKSNANKVVDDGYTIGTGANQFNVYSSTAVPCP